MANVFNEFISRLDVADQRNGEFEDRSIELFKLEYKKKKNRKNQNIQIFILSGKITKRVKCE